MPLWRWSKTSSDNATADPTINYAEGQAPSSLNDSARAMMSAVAMYRDDISGAIVTGGTSTAYTVASNSVFDTLAHLNNQIVAFTPHTTNGATVTLNVDGLGAKPLRTAPSTELLAGVLIQGTPYVAIYNNTDGAFYLRGFYGNPYNIPLGGGLDFWGTTAPNTSFAFPTGQAISRTIYASLFALIGTTYGTGDGSTTFNLPNKSGRVSSMLDATGTILTSFSMSPNANTLGATGGAQAHTLTANEIPTITSSGSNSISVTSSVSDIVQAPSGLNSVSAPGGGNTIINNAGALSAITSSGSNSISVTSNNTGGAAHLIVQPTIICNYIIRII